ncbi:hypothetical protein INR49_006621, partial [Caranx melampygus]
MASIAVDSITRQRPRGNQTAHHWGGGGFIATDPERGRRCRTLKDCGDPELWSESAALPESVRVGSTLSSRGFSSDTRPSVGRCGHVTPPTALFPRPPAAPEETLGAPSAPIT